MSKGKRSRPKKSRKSMMVMPDGIFAAIRTAQFKVETQMAVRRQIESQVAAIRFGGDEGLDMHQRVGQRFLIVDFQGQADRLAAQRGFTAQFLQVSEGQGLPRR